MKVRESYKDPFKFENQIVDNITILNCINPNENPKLRKFNAICKCGEYRIVSQYAIIHRKKLQCQKCGWKQLGIKKQKPDAGINNVFIHYRKSAERRHINFYLDKDQVKKLTSDNCVYCGQEPNLKSFSEKTYKNRTQYIYNTIDRIDSDKDYSIDNCVTACKTCNISKNVQKHDDFINWIRKVYNYTKENK